MNAMTYQEAAKTRKKSLLSLVTEKLIEGQGVGSSIKGAVSEKSAARMKGIKEKFDPMNIIKFMTGGSKLAAALYGSMAGRSKEDMKYFTGVKAKEVGDTATKIGTLETDNEVLSILNKIYQFMARTAEEDKLRREEENNRKEEIEYERGLRHKELIEALTGLAKPGKTITAEKVKDENSFGGIFSALIGFVKDLVSKAIKGVMSVIKGIKETLEKIISAFGPNAFKLLTSIGRFFISNPIGIAIVAGLAAGQFLKLLVKLQLEDQEKNPEKYKDTPLTRAKREDTTMGVAGERNRRESVKQFRASEIRDALDAKPQYTDEELIEIYGKPRSELQAFVDKNPKGVLKMYEVPASTPTSQAEAQDLENGVSQQVSENQSSQKAVPVPPATPPSDKLNEKTKEMNNLNLPTPAIPPKSETVNTTNVVADKKVLPQGPLPAVRNQEPTFKNLILYSTRVV